jgi:(S)-2-hydroxyglutarate dehydrogenase
MSDFDLAVIGGGIVGLSTAMQMTERFPGISVAVLEKEPALARHQTGRNSGVIHAGVYYQPGSLKAQFCREGVEATTRFCCEHGIAYEQCGKLLVATDAGELPRMEALYERARVNGLDVERLDKAEVARREPRIRGLGGVFVKTTGIVDYAQVAKAMADMVAERGGAILTSSEVAHIEETPSGVTLDVGRDRIRAQHVIAAAGLQADRIARLCGVDVDFRIVPFRGEYYRLGADKDHIVNHLIYPIPDPSLPFLGVHLTRHIGGDVLVGPTALMAGARDAYRVRRIRPADLAATLVWPGTWRMARRWWRTGLAEVGYAASRGAFVRAAQRYVPDLQPEDVQPGPAGVRAQALGRDGALVDDFVISHTGHALHVRNAPSPAATSSLAIARLIVDRAQEAFGLRPAERPGAHGAA